MWRAAAPSQRGAPLADNWKTDLNSMYPPQFIHFHSGRSYLEGNSGFHFPRVTLADCQAYMGEVWAVSPWEQWWSWLECLFPGAQGCTKASCWVSPLPLLKGCFWVVVFTGRSEAKLHVSLGLAEVIFTKLIYHPIFTWWDGFVLHTFNPTLTHASNSCQSGFRKYILLMHLCSRDVVWVF